MAGPEAVAYAAVGAVILMASLFGFNLLAERLFVTRREFEQFQKALDIRLSKLEQTTSSGFDKLNDRIDKAFTAMAHSKDG